ncbi:hypothetical protein HS7_06850 [Sulfolobales archaeon HS-7]|nr:hypothetical protein HS7_06850 [Sulfolobales archaeon HS-7]
MAYDSVGNITIERLAILVDTNILMYVYDGIDVFQLVADYLEYSPKFYIHRLVINELKSKETRSGKLGAKARIAENYLQKKLGIWEIIDDNVNGEVDRALLETAIARKMVLFTNDKTLIKEAKLSGVKVITLGRKGKIIKGAFDI